jgi:hypothetical protein
MRKPRAAAPNLDTLIADVGRAVAWPVAPKRVSVLLDGRLIARFIHAPTMPARMKPVIRNEGKDIR